MKIKEVHILLKSLFSLYIKSSNPNSNIYDQKKYLYFAHKRYSEFRSTTHNQVRLMVFHCHLQISGILKWFRYMLD